MGLWITSDPDAVAPLRCAVMSFVVSVHPSSGAPGVPICLEPDGVATVAQLRVQLAELLGVEVAALRVGGTVVPDALVVGAPPLLHGCEIVITQAPTQNLAQPPTQALAQPLTQALARGPHGTGQARVPSAGRPISCGPVMLHVLAGPDAGHRIPLRTTATIGRAAGCDLALADPGLSRAHASARLTPEGILVTDLGSTNGLVLICTHTPTGATNTVADSEPAASPADRNRGRAGHDVSPTRDSRLPAASGSNEHVTRLLRPGDAVRLASTRVALGGPGGPPGHVAPDGRGHLRFTPRRQARPDLRDETLEPPRPPAPEPRSRMPWLAALLPVPVAAVLAVALGPLMLWFAALSPVTMLGAAWGDRITARRRERAAAREHEAAVAAWESDCRARLLSEAEALEAMIPDPAALLDAAEQRSGGLWSVPPGSPGVGTVRLGWGRPPSRITVRHRDSGVAQRLDHLDAPVLHDVIAAQVTTILGTRERVAGVVRLLVGQLLTTHSPEAVRVVLVGVDEDWRWVPHAVVATTVDQVREALTAESHDGHSARLLVIGPHASSALVAATRTRAESAGASLLIGHADAAALPGTTTLTLGADTDTLNRPGEPDVQLLTDAVGPWWCTRIARALAPLVPGERSDGTCPTHLTDLVGVQPDWYECAANEPETRDPRAVATLGLSEGRPWCIDLDQDGPHLLIGGTTGSGKSELLRVLITSLAQQLPPHDLSFLLVDYKGGASFGACADLPHTAGVLTDLDPVLAQRALTSLRAEVTRRERLLARYGAVDRAGFLAVARTPEERAQLPRLVIVIDEFRALAQEQPEVLSGIVHIAAVGRSLGIHLVLATQRPGGVVSPEIRANVNLRIALRMRDRHDSIDVIDCPDAAQLPSSAPGRALARLGDGELVPFRVLPISTPPPTRRAGLRVALVEDAACPDRLGDPATAGPGGLDLVVESIRTARRKAGSPLPPPVWQPPLPGILPADDLPTDVVGIIDVPTEQRRDELRFEPGTGHWLIVGGPGSGRTTSLLTIIESLGASHPPDEVHIHVLETGHALRDRLAAGSDLPHMGTLTGVDEPRRAARLLERLRALSDEFAGTPGPAAGTATAHAALRPRTVLVVDGADQLDGGDRFGPRPLGDALAELLAGATGPGLTVVMSAGGSALIGRLTERARTTLLLPLADRADLAIAGIGRSAVPGDWRPGRALRLPDAAQVQLVVPGRRTPAPRGGERTAPRDQTGRGGQGQASAGQARRGPAGEPDPSRAFVIEDLPTLLPSAALPPSSRDRLALGVHGDPVQTLTWSPSDHGRTLVVLGPPRSGRTETLARIAASALDGGRRAIWVAGGRPPRPGQLPEGISLLGPGEAGRLVAERRAHPDVAIVVDDAHGILDTDVQEPLLQAARLLERDDGLLAVALDPAHAANQYRGIAHATALGGHGILLGSRGRVDGSLLGLHGLTAPEPLPGRALLARNGTIEEVQLALAM